VTKLLRATTVLAVLAAAAGCGVHQTEAPPLAGPSTFALALEITASPDSLTQDGVSRSTIKVTTHDASGRPQANVPVRLDMRVSGVAADYGSLASRTVTTGSDGTITTVYTAPPPPPAGSNPPTCGGVPGQCVDIVATPILSDYQTSVTQFVQLRLIPQGVIVPPADTPTPNFSYSPSPARFKIPTTFDASTSCAGSTPCLDTSGIVSYSWNFGDGSTATGLRATHTFNAVATYDVTLTVTNDRGVSASTTQQVDVTTTTGPTADFVFSPSDPAPGQEILFNAETSTSVAGHDIVIYHWDFGDGVTGEGRIAKHTYAQGGTYAVVLSIADDTGQRAVTSKPVEVQ
jgi:chitodextrinase